MPDHQGSCWKGRIVSHDLLPEELDAVEAAAVYAEGRYPVSADDVYQEIWIWILMHWSKVEQWREAGSLGAFKKAVRNAAHDYCEAERIVTLGSDPLDHCPYSRGRIRALLPEALEIEWYWPNGDGVAATYDARISELVDIRRAYEGALSDWGREILDYGAVVEFDYEELAAYLVQVNQEKGVDDNEVSAEAARERVAYHVDRMRAYLGGPDSEKEYTGSRKPINSAEAAAIYTRQYGG